MKRLMLLTALFAMIGIANADVTVVVGDNSAPWMGWMNVSELPVNGGGYLWGSGWGIPDLCASFDDGANTLTLSPNTIGDPAEYWYIGGGAPGNPGNKMMEANLYVEDDSLNVAGSTLTFEGEILSNTFTDAHSTRIFVSEFAADYSSRVDSFFDVVAPGAFSVSLTTSGTAGNHIQYGFQTKGENVWVTDVAPFGSVVFETVPEPATLALLGLGGLLLRRKK